MRNFRREIETASEISAEIPSTEFSWSLTRHLLFRKCERAYFFRYYFTQGGWDRYAEHVIRRAYAEKASLSYSEWLGVLSDSAMKRALDRVRSVRPALRFSLFRNSFQEAVAKQLELIDDVDLFDFPFSREDLLRKAEFDISNSFCVFLKSPEFEMLLRMQRPNMINSNLNYECYHGDTRVWFNPGIMWFEPGIRCSLRIMYTQFNEEICRMTADVFAFYSRTLFKAEHSVSFFVASDGNEWQVYQFCGNAGYADEMIAASIAGMKMKIRSGNVVCVSDFPEIGLPEVCRECRFCGTCAVVREI